MDREQENLVILASNVLRFAANHPYAATGIFGAAVGSAVTYGVLTSKSLKFATDGILTPKVYEIALSREDLRRMSVDPEAWIRMETPEITVVITSEKRQPLRQIPDIVID